jgi:hypothetical protein
MPFPIPGTGLKSELQGNKFSGPVYDMIIGAGFNPPV